MFIFLPFLVTRLTPYFFLYYIYTRILSSYLSSLFIFLLTFVDWSLMSSTSVHHHWLRCSHPHLHTLHIFLWFNSFFPRFISYSPYLSHVPSPTPSPYPIPILLVPSLPSIPVHTPGGYANVSYGNFGILHDFVPERKACLCRFCLDVVTTDLFLYLSSYLSIYLCIYKFVCLSMWV